MLLVGIFDLILTGIVGEDCLGHHHVEVGDEIVERFAAAVGYRDAAGWKAGADDCDEDGLGGVVGIPTRNEMTKIDELASPLAPSPSDDGRPHWDSRAVDGPSKTPAEIGLRKWLKSAVRNR